MKKSIVILISAAVYLTMASAIMVWFLYTIAASGNELQKRVTLIATENAKVQSHTELMRLIDATRVQRETLASYLLKEDTTSDFLTSIELAGANIGVTLTTQSLKVVPQEGETDVLAVEFVIAGSERAVEQMLSVIESLPYHSQVQSLTLTKTNGTVRAKTNINVTLAKHDQ